MKKRLTILATLLVVFSLEMVAIAFSQTSSVERESAAGESVRSATVLTIRGKITAINKDRKMVTLEANGKTVSFRVENPHNLNVANVGEPVLVRYYEVVTIRKKRPGEVVSAVSLREGISTARSGSPAAVAQLQATALVTIRKIDRENAMVSIDGSDGSIEEVKARNPANLKHVKVGDELLVTVTRATAIAVEKDSAH
jgi:hypothetical protein